MRVRRLPGRWHLPLSRSLTFPRTRRRQAKPAMSAARRSSRTLTPRFAARCCGRRRPHHAIALAPPIQTYADGAMQAALPKMCLPQCSKYFPTQKMAASSISVWLLPSEDGGNSNSVTFAVFFISAFIKAVMRFGRSPYVPYQG